MVKAVKNKAKSKPINRRRDTESVNKSRQMRRRWQRIRIYVFTFFAVTIGGGSYYTYKHELWKPYYHYAEQSALQKVVDEGLYLENIEITGLKNLSERAVESAVYAAIRPVDGKYPILGFSLNTMIDHLTSYGWVKEARVMRKLPDTIMVDIEEREPKALWQYKGQLSLIDVDGRVLTREGLRKFTHLPVLVGEDAGIQSTSLFRFLSVEPDLESRVASAVRVGGRRWNIQLDNGLEIMLPEANPENAWAKLAELEKSESILDRDIKMIDMRLEDRLFLTSR